MSTAKYTPPTYRAKLFNCPHCGALAQMTWTSLLVSSGAAGLLSTPFSRCECAACAGISLWMGVVGDMGVMVLPTAATAPLASPDLPEDCRLDYDEARQISRVSPRGAAALLRLCIQKLCKHLGQPGKDINADIGALVRGGLPVRVQQALDTVRVVGNEAVHPGTLSNEDHADRVDTLFKLVNIIVDHMITQPKEIADLFSQLPAPKLAGIADRDRPKG